MQVQVLSSAVFPTGVVQLVYAPTQMPSRATYDDVTDNLPDAGEV